MIRSVVFAAIVCTLLAASACGAEDQACTVPEGEGPDWIRVIRCERDYSLLWVERDDAVFSRTRTINWLIDLEDENRTYFIDSETWALHYHFASSYLNQPDKSPVGTHAEFNLLNYRRENRRFVLGKLVRYLDQDLLTIEFSAGDTADADMIESAYHLIADHLYDGDRLRYRPISNSHDQMLPELEARIPVVRTDEVFRGQSYQALNQVAGYGTLRFRRVSELSGQPVAPTDIVVLDRVPNDISLVSGIITDEFQTPLSHINILSKNRGTPNMARRGAFDDEELRALDGELVRLTVGPQDFAVEPATVEEAESFWLSLRPESELVPAVEREVIADVLDARRPADVIDLKEVSYEDVSRVGAKAANMGEIMRIGRKTQSYRSDGAISVPDQPFAIPFSFYEHHLAASGIDAEIEELLADAPQLEPDELEERLFALRWRIFRAPFSPGHLSRVAAAVRRRWGEEARVRFRSSTNVEDLRAFSGAGLYTSASASLDEGELALADAIKVVWASAWNAQAFVERDFYRVRHQRVRMGVLVHPAFVDEMANGVAATINEFADNRPAYYINSQVGEVSVTNPTGFAVPEQILYYTWYEQPEYEVITHSSLLERIPGWPAGTSVFTDGELDVLAAALERIHLHFKRLYRGGPDFAMDVEFKLVAGRRVVIKQARPLTRR